MQKVEFEYNGFFCCYADHAKRLNLNINQVNGAVHRKGLTRVDALDYCIRLNIQKERIAKRRAKVNAIMKARDCSKQMAYRCTDYNGDLLPEKPKQSFIYRGVYTTGLGHCRRLGLSPSVLSNRYKYGRTREEVLDIALGVAPKPMNKTQRCAFAGVTLAQVSQRATKNNESWDVAFNYVVEYQKRKNTK